MYFPYFVAYMTAGIAAGAVVFAWALHSGQFRDQQRARFLPLEPDAAPAPAAASRIRRWEIYALIVLACAGLAATAAVLVFSILKFGSV